MASPFSKKGVFHSELVAAGTIRARVSGSPQKSKFGKDKLDYIVLKVIDEEDQTKTSEHQYQIENDECNQALQGLAGKLVDITATGTRDDARLEINVVNGESRAAAPPPAQTQQRQPAQQPAKQPAQPAAAPDDRATVEAKTFKRAKVFGARIAVLWEVALRHTLAIVDKYNAPLDEKDRIPFTVEDIRAIANTIFIELKNGIDVHTMPYKWPEEQPKPEAAKPQPAKPAPAAPPPQQPPPPPLEEEEDDIPF